MSTGEHNLQVLLRSLDPVLDPEVYVFGSLSASELERLGDLIPLGTFQEGEGLSVIVTQAEATEAGLADAPVFRRITLQVHSSLEAVGLTAAVATCLTERGISANVVAATYHDHVFVPAARAEEAIAALRDLAAASDAN